MLGDFFYVSMRWIFLTKWDWKVMHPLRCLMQYATLVYKHKHHACASLCIWLLLLTAAKSCLLTGIDSMEKGNLARWNLIPSTYIIMKSFIQYATFSLQFCLWWKILSVQRNRFSGKRKISLMKFHSKEYNIWRALFIMLFFPCNFAYDG
jgi:hypothetical protein